MIQVVTTGVSRTVVLAGRWAFKVPSRRGGFIRGWLANRSEWVQRDREGVARPVLTLGHVVLVMPRAERTWPEPYRWESYGDDGDEGKGSSWGLFGEHWLLIDYDRYWEHPRGLVGGLYVANQERLSRKWMKLPALDDVGD